MKKGDKVKILRNGDIPFDYQNCEGVIVSEWTEEEKYNGSANDNLRRFDIMLSKPIDRIAWFDEDEFVLMENKK